MAPTTAASPERNLDALFPGQTAAKWILSLLPSLAMLAAGLLKFFPQKEMLDATNMTKETLAALGAIILVSLALYWIPRTALFGVVLLTAYLGGATSISLFNAGQSPVAPIVLGVLLWIGYGLRFPRVMAAARVI
jgi:hypothetical protein